MFFDEQRYIFLKPEEPDVPVQVESDQFEQLKEDAKVLGPCLEAVWEITAMIMQGRPERAWTVFYQEFLNKPDQAKRYIDLVAKDYNLIYKLSEQVARIPGLRYLNPFKVQAAGLEMAADGAKWVLDKIQGVNSSEVFANAKESWQDLDPEQQEAFKEWGINLIGEFPVMAEQADTHEQVVNVVGSDRI